MPAAPINAEAAAHVTSPFKGWTLGSVQEQQTPGL